MNADHMLWVTFKLCMHVVQRVTLIKKKKAGPVSNVLMTGGWAVLCLKANVFTCGAWQPYCPP